MNAYIESVIETVKKKHGNEPSSSRPWKRF